MSAFPWPPGPLSDADILSGCRLRQVDKTKLNHTERLDRIELQATKNRSTPDSRKKNLKNLTSQTSLWFFNMSWQYWSRHLWENGGKPMPRHMNTGCSLALRARSRLIRYHLVIFASGGARRWPKSRFSPPLKLKNKKNWLTTWKSDRIQSW